MKFRIAQKLLQTDWYEVDADNPEDALRLYDAIKGNLVSYGSTPGWSFPGNEETVAVWDERETTCRCGKDKKVLVIRE